MTTNVGEITILRNGRVFDGRSFLDGPRDVILEDGHISEVIPSGQGIEYSPQGVMEVNCSGKTILPGFIDCHVHLMTNKYNPALNALEPFSYAYYQSVRNAEAMINSGVTSARDLAGADAGMKDAIAAGVIAGPRLSTSINALSITGGHADNWLRSGVEYHVINSNSPGKPSGIADGIDQVRKVTRQMFRAGADVIKICATGGVLSTTDHPHHSQFSLDEIRVVVEEAHAHGSYVAAHAIGAEGIKNALRGGVKSIEHAIYLDDEAIELMLEHDAYVVPTLTAPRNVIEYGHDLPTQMVDKAKEVVEKHVSSLIMAVEAGVKIAMGSDAGVGPHGHSLDELSAMAECGMSLEQVLASATSVASELFPSDWKIGRLKPGYFADILLVDTELTATSQLKDLTNTVEQVWQQGKRVR